MPDLGTLMGKVSLNDLHCNSIANCSGVTVAIEGTTFSAETDSTGAWSMTGIPAGIYNVIIAKPGFDTTLVPKYEFGGDGTQFLEYEIAYERPADSIPITAFSATQKDTIELRIGRRDSIHWPDTLQFYDTTFDTIGSYLTLNISVTMGGPDSAVAFTGNIVDQTHPTNFAWPFSNNGIIARGATLTGQSYSWQFYTDTSQYYGPRAGDTIVVRTYAVGCGQHYGHVQSKTLIVP